MTKTQIFIAAVIAVLLLNLIVFPLINRRSFEKMPWQQKVRIIMKEAKGLVYFKNVSYGSKGILYYVKNKRKILTLPWVLRDGEMLCTKEEPFLRWDYPEEREPLNPDELTQLLNELEKYNSKKPVKLSFKDK